MTSGRPPTGGNVAATIESLWTSNATHRRTSAGAHELTSGMAGPPSHAALAATATRTGEANPRTGEREDQPVQASMLTKPASPSPCRPRRASRRGRCALTGAPAPLTSARMGHTIKLGESITISSGIAPYQLVFVDDGDTGYVYVLDQRRGEQPILDALHIYNVR